MLHRGRSEVGTRLTAGIPESGMSYTNRTYVARRRRSVKKRAQNAPASSTVEDVEEAYREFLGAMFDMLRALELMLDLTLDGIRVFAWEASLDRLGHIVRSYDEVQERLAKVIPPAIYQPFHARMRAAIEMRQEGLKRMETAVRTHSLNPTFEDGLRRYTLAGDLLLAAGTGRVEPARSASISDKR
jgi:hypothetical protein